MSALLKTFAASCRRQRCGLYAKLQKLSKSLKNELRKIGQPIPENDIWIAAIAIENDLILANKDQHFNRIEELKQEKW